MRLVPGLARRLVPLARLAETSGVKLFVVGGCVRDALRGRSAKDLDLAVSGDPRVLAEKAARKWGGSCEAFDRFGTVRLKFPDGSRIDMARARTETYPSPAALPVVAPASIEEDLRRRDFTVNAMARPLTPLGIGALYDPFGGAADLASGLLRILHPRSFIDDPTRLYRAARYGGRFHLRLENVTARCLKTAVRGGLPGRLSRERIRQELIRLLEESDPGPGMRRLRAWGLLREFHPRFVWPRQAGRAPDPRVRLGLCALAMPKGAGEELLRSLPLPRETSQMLISALKVSAAQASPRGQIDPLAFEILRLHHHRRPASAWRPALVRGGDLEARGLTPGKAFSVWTERAARAQWRGAFRDRAGALRWLRARVKTVR